MNIKHNDIKTKAREAASLLKVIAHPKRLIALCALAEGEQSVGELAHVMGVRSSTASQTLAIMRRHNVVTQRRDGQTIYYSLHDPIMRSIIRTLDRAYCRKGKRA